MLNLSSHILCTLANIPVKSYNEWNIDCTWSDQDAKLATVKTRVHMVDNWRPDCQ